MKGTISNAKQIIANINKLSLENINYLYLFNALSVFDLFSINFNLTFRLFKQSI